MTLTEGGWFVAKNMPIWYGDSKKSRFANHFSFHPLISAQLYPFSTRACCATTQ